MFELYSENLLPETVSPYVKNCVFPVVNIILYNKDIKTETVSDWNGLSPNQ